MYNVEDFRAKYPDWFQETTPTDIIVGVIFFSLLFIVPYIYIRLIEVRLTSFVEDRLIPFIEFRLRLKRVIDVFHRILQIRIFGNPGSRI